MKVIEDRQIRRALLAIEVPLLAFILAMVLMGTRGEADISAVCRYQAEQPGDWRYIIIHHSATAGGNVDMFDEYHRSLGMDEVAYHFVIGNGDKSGDGEIEVADRWRKQKHGAHAGVEPYNRQGIGICLVGNFDTADTVTNAQFESLVGLVTELARRFNIPIENILRHSDVRSTKCPGRHFPFDELIARVKNNLATAETE